MTKGHRAERTPSSGGHWGKIEYLYEDRDILVVSKPAGLAVIAPEGSRAKTLYDLVTDHMRRTNPRARPAVVHRLDRDTSGVMMFAKSAAGKKILMSRWNELVKERIYVALAEGTFQEESGVFDSWLVENRAGTVYAAKAGTGGALRAVTKWRALKKGTLHCLLELSLETGRKHQIRAQLSATGHPVAGDARYGARTDPLGRLCLHATVLTLEHPFSRRVMRFESPFPDEFRSFCAN
jgi:23S rRNA pseudouridine1911/1915/1917 synthase